MSRVSSLADADDLVSKTCVRMLEHEKQFQLGTSLIAWAITILRNLHLDNAKSGHVRLRAVEPPTDFNDPLSSKKIEDPLELKEVHRLILQLPVEQREVLILKAVGFSYAEIGERLGILIETVTSRLHRGRKALEELTERNERVAV